MLAPDQRELLLEALRPPDGYAFDCGVGTTFSLDLTALLIAPLSLALLDVADPEAALQDPVVLLEGVRRYADRLTLFCQAGRIAIPRRDSYLFRYLERMVVEVQAPGGGVFHPKVWLMRYTPTNGDDPPLYRLLNLTRNLTFDRSWDLMLRLEGELAARRTYGYSRNRPLGNFVAQLPGLALRRPDDRVLAQIELLQDEVRRVDFEPPELFSDEIAFWPAGLPGRRPYRFDRRCDRALVISPFLSDRLLERVTERGSGHVLVSRAESIAKLRPATRQRFDRIYVLQDADALEDEHTADEVGDTELGARSDPHGLHAKLYVLEAGWYTRWLVGSANATWAAFYEHNVEFLTELSGRRSQIGIDTILGKDGDDNALMAMLLPYEEPDEPDGDRDQELAAERLADSMRDQLLDAGLSLEVQAREDEGYDLVLRSGSKADAAARQGVTVAVWPVGLPESRAQPVAELGEGAELRFNKLTSLALTSFIAFEVTATCGAARHTLRFVLNLSITGLPDDIDAQVVSAILSDRGQFLRYLRLLLAEPNGEQWLASLATGAEQPWRDALGEGDLPLLRYLVRALSRAPEKLDQIDEVVAKLESTAQGQAALPEDFMLLWQSLRQAAEDVQR